MNIIEATKIIDCGLLTTNNGYKIVEKEETKVLIKTLKQCKTIRDAFGVMSYPSQDDIIDEAIMIKMMNEQIMKKIKRMYRYYSRHYDIHFDDEDFGEDLISEFGFEGLRQKNLLNNIAKICEKIRSWEDIPC